MNHEPNREPRTRTRNQEPGTWNCDVFEYLLQVPANRIGYQRLSLTQLKIIQAVVTLSVFVPFALLYMRQPVSWNFLWAGSCLLGAVYFMFR